MAEIVGTVRRSWADTPPDAVTIRALIAVAKGEATKTQQQKAMNWILHRACGTSLDTFVPGDPQTSAYRAGRRAAGLMIVDAMQTPVSQEETTDKETGEKNTWQTKSQPQKRSPRKAAKPRTRKPR